MPDLAVVHLVRRQNGIVPFERFIASWRAHPAGVPNDLVILFKGFKRNHTPEFDRLLEGIPYRRLLVSDRGFDISAYFEAIERLEYQRYCFLNSFSRILVSGWLERMHRFSVQEGVGLVGATGSAQSIVTGYTARHKDILALPPMARLRARIARVLTDRRPQVVLGRAWVWALRLTGIWRPARDFPMFPNYHLRTNAFMGTRNTLSRIRLGALRTKLSAYAFESGNESLTNQVTNLGLRVLVVGRDGDAYEPERWHLSNTFWQSREENLLVADNQTESYLAAGADQRAYLAQSAWGDNARPG